MWRWVQGADRFRGRWGGSLSLLFFFACTVHAWRMPRTCCERHLKNLVEKLAWLRTMRTQKMTDLPFLPHFAPIMAGWKDSRIRKVTIVFRYIGVYPLFPYVPLNHDWWWGKSSHCGGKWLCYGQARICKRMSCNEFWRTRVHHKKSFGERPYIRYLLSYCT